MPNEFDPDFPDLNKLVPARQSSRFLDDDEEDDDDFEIDTTQWDEE